MVNNLEKVACKVCGGKGGWKKEINNWSEDNWNDCLYCEGYGFTDKDKDDDKKDSMLLEYNKYANKIVNIMEDIGELVYCQTEDMGRVIKIGIVPKYKSSFTMFVKNILRFGHRSRDVKTSVSQKFFYDERVRKVNYYWEIELKPRSVRHLEGIIEYMDEWR